MPVEDPPQPQLPSGQGLQWVQCDVAELCANFLGVSRKMVWAAYAGVMGLRPSSVLKFLLLFWDGIESKMSFLSIATTGKHKVKSKLLLIFSKPKLTAESCLCLVTARQMSENCWEPQCPYVSSHAELVFAAIHMFLPPRPSRLQGWGQLVPLKTTALHQGRAVRGLSQRLFNAVQQHGEMPEG